MSARLVLVAAGLAVAGAGAVLAAVAPHRGEAAAGARLYDGRTALVAHIEGHPLALPAQAARCINCHHPAGATGGPSERLGPALSARTLREAQARRGGPPSRFDAASLCTLLRTGVDPAWVTVTKAMPRYTLSDAECGQLWRHLTAS